MADPNDLKRAVAGALLDGLEGRHTHIDPLKALDGLTDADMARRPCAGAMTLGEQLNHTQFWSELLLKNLRTGEPTWDAAGWTHDYLGELGGWAALHERMRQTLAEIGQVIRDADDLTNRYGRADGFTFVDLARIEVSHVAYHTAQLVMSRRVLGLWPPDRR